MKTTEHFITIINILFHALIGPRCKIVEKFFDMSPSSDLTLAKCLAQQKAKKKARKNVEAVFDLDYSKIGYRNYFYTISTKYFIPLDMPITFKESLAVNVFITSACPHEMEDAKAAYKSGEILDQSPPITLENIKRKLKESGIFDWQDPTLNEREKKELSKLFDAVEIMTTSRARQPSNVQNVFSSLRLVERAVKKQLKEGQISETLAAKFHWEKLSARHRRDKPTYHLDKKTSMRVFNTMN